WKEINFQVPPSWGRDAAGLFVYDPVAKPLPAAKNSNLSMGWTSSYFRFVFNFNQSLAGTKLFLRHIVDDGIVAYINGVEVTRFNLPAGTIQTNTGASATVGTASSVGPIQIPVS